MDAKEFLSTVLSESGLYCVVAIRADTPTPIQKFYGSIDLAIKAALDFDARGYSTYYALGTFVEGTNRKASNVDSLKALFLDIDCGTDKPYATQRDAFVALKALCKSKNLPKPTWVINSGKGLHIYWGLDKAYSPIEWLPVANRLKTVCLESGLDIDPVVTSDSARILRMPQTHNYKTSPPTRVEALGTKGDSVSLSDFYDILGRPARVAELQARAFSEQDDETMRRLLGNYTSKFTNILQKNASKKGCHQIHRAIDTPNEISYPSWVDVISIIKHCEEGMPAVHAVSKLYSGYSESETDSIADSILYPHLCTTFESNNPSGCEGCPLRGKIKSPIVLARETREATAEDNIIQIAAEDHPDTPTQPAPKKDNVVARGETTVTSTLPFRDGLAEDEDLPKVRQFTTYEIPTYPFPYFRPANGGIFKRTQVKGDDGQLENEDEEIYHNDFYLVGRLFDKQRGPLFVFRHHSSREGIQEFAVEGVKISSELELKKELALNDIHPNNDKQLFLYVKKWVRELLATKDQVILKTQFGWTADHESFVLGDREIFADRIEKNLPSSKTAQYFKMLAKRGTLDEWKKIPAFYNRPNFQPHQFMFGLAFGAPLMEFISDAKGGVFHTFSEESGLGKSTGQMGGASVWGNPSGLVLRGKDTLNAIFNRAEVYKNLPVYIDEFTNVSGKNMSDFAYDISAGFQRGRMSNSGENAERERGESWALLAGTTANKSMIETMMTFKDRPEGENQRVIEHVMQRLLLPEDRPAATAMNDCLLDNYGHAGEAYIQNVLRSIPAVKKLLAKVKLTLETKAGLDTKHRVWAAECASVTTGLLLAKSYGLIDWDLDAFMDWVVSKLKSLKVESKELGIGTVEIINQYYHEHWSKVLRIKATLDARTGEKAPLQDVLITPDAKPLHEIVARHEYDTNTLYLLPRPFRTWCVEKGYYSKGIIERMESELGAVTLQIRIGKGTNVNLPPTRVMKFQFVVDVEKPNDDPFSGTDTQGTPG